MNELARIEAFRGQWAGTWAHALEMLDSFRQSAQTASLRAALTMAGVEMSEGELERAGARLLVAPLVDGEQRFAAAYVDALFDATGGSTADVLGFDDVERVLRAFDERWHSEMSPAHSACLAALVRWVCEALGANQQHPLFVVGTFVVRFVALHSGLAWAESVARLLAIALLARVGYEFVIYESFDRVWLQRNRELTKALYRAVDSRPGADAGLHDWLLAFLRALNHLIRQLEGHAAAQRALVPLSALDDQLLELVRRRGRVRLCDAEAATEVSRNTLKVHFRRLTRLGLLQLRGRGRATWYEGG